MFTIWSVRTLSQRRALPWRFDTSLNFLLLPSDVDVGPRFLVEPCHWAHNKCREKHNVLTTMRISL